MIARALVGGALLFFCLVNLGCGGGGTSSGSNTSSTSASSTPNQTWLLDFGADPHVAGRREQAKVLVTGFTYSGTFSETSDSPGVYVYNGDGSCRYKISIGGSVSHNGTYDNWTFSGVTGSGCGYNTVGNGGGTANGAYPAAGSVSGTLTLNTQSPLGTTSNSGNWTGTIQ